VRVQAGDYRGPIAEIRDAGEEEIPGAGKEVERKTCEQKKSQSNRCACGAAQCNPKHHGSHQVRHRSTRGNKSRVEVAGPRNGRQHTRFCAGEQSRRSMTQPFMQDIGNDLSQEANRTDG